MFFLLIFSFSISAKDTPNDAGGSITVSTYNIPNYTERIELYRKVKGDTLYREAGLVSLYKGEFDDTLAVAGEGYLYRARAITKDTVYTAMTEEFVSSSPQWFNKSRTAVLLFLIIFGSFVFVFIQLAKKIPEGLFIRRLPAIDAIDEAVGRSTEMGRPVLFIPGIEYITDAGTLASITILQRVGKKVAEHGTRIIHANFDPVVMTAAQETLKNAYAEAGRPDAFNKDDVFYLTSEQFGFAAGVDGIMERERPGAIFLQGYFYAESLILAETGYSIGAIQIAGTNATTQLPFFVAACDYVLMGEEMFAASAYISKEPRLLGSIKGSDLAKSILLGLIGIGVTFGTVASLLKQAGNPAYMEIFNKVLDFLAMGAR
ncbi:MAG: DUF6754 domain-containing protein [candidate division WOR-3 bacterium]|nr:DUF6754 domain-containing protein [candidate division WOR-3 bacterium]